MITRSTTAEDLALEMFRYGLEKSEASAVLAFALANEWRWGRRGMSETEAVDGLKREREWVAYEAAKKAKRAAEEAAIEAQRETVRGLVAAILADGDPWRRDRVEKTVDDSPLMSWDKGKLLQELMPAPTPEEARYYEARAKQDREDRDEKFFHGNGRPRDWVEWHDREHDN